MKNLMPFFLALLLFASCNKEKAIEKMIQPPIPELNIPFQSYQVNPAGDTLKIESGTRIIIPEGALIDSLGNPIKDAEIDYREFNDAIDIFLSGIPMTFKSFGKEQQMITGGMFEIRAKTSDNRSVFIHPEKEIQIQYASKQSILNHDFFGFNETTNSWEFINSPKNEVNPEIEKIEENIKKLQPKLKFPLGTEYFALNYWQLVDVLADNLDYSYYNDKNKAKRKFREYGFSAYNVQNYDYITYKGKKEMATLFLWKNLKGSKLPSWLEDCYYRDTKFTHLYGNIYRFEAKKDNKKYIGKFERIMPLWALFRFKPDYWKKNYEEALAKIDAEEKRLETEAKVLRSFSVNQFGIYNFDVLIKAKKYNVPADFTLSSSVELEDNSIYNMNQIYIIFAENSSVIKLKRSQWNSFSFMPKYRDYVIFTVLPDNKFAIYPKEKFEQINIDSIIKLENPSFKFVLENEDAQVKSKADIKALLKL